jgi:hypothetical protein
LAVIKRFAVVLRFGNARILQGMRKCLKQARNGI